MKLFIDDQRECPVGWEVARTITQAIRLLATGYVTEVSLDHDIVQTVRGDQELETFEPVAYYVSLIRDTDTSYREDQKMVVRIHTGNVEAGARMAKIIGIPYNNEIYNPEDYK